MDSNHLTNINLTQVTSFLNYINKIYDDVQEERNQLQREIEQIKAQIKSCGAENTSQTLNKIATICEVANLNSELKKELQFLSLIRRKNSDVLFCHDDQSHLSTILETSEKSDSESGSAESS